MQSKGGYSEILPEENFSYEMVSMDKIKKLVFKLNSKKSSTYVVIPASILKQAMEVHLKQSGSHYQSFLKRTHFP